MVNLSIAHGASCKALNLYALCSMRLAAAISMEYNR